MSIISYGEFLIALVDWQMGTVILCLVLTAIWILRNFWQLIQGKLKSCGDGHSHCHDCAIAKWKPNHCSSGESQSDLGNQPVLHQLEIENPLQEAEILAKSRK